MELRGTKRIDKFSKKYNQARKPLKDWVKVVKNAQWKNFSDIKATFNSADKVDDYIVFDIGGNKYRLIAVVVIVKGVVVIDRIMTHEEYNKWSS